MALHPPIDLAPEVVREALAPLRNDFSVALCGPGNAFAVGAVIRVAHSFLAQEVIVIGRAGGALDDAEAAPPGQTGAAASEAARGTQRPRARAKEDGRRGQGRDWYAKAAMGMDKYETVVRVPDEGALLEALRGRPLWVVEKDVARRSIQSVPAFPAGVVFAFGSERWGVPASLLAMADDVIGIPIYGVNHSLPVAVAAGIVMQEWARRRYTEGLTL